MTEQSTYGGCGSDEPSQTVQFTFVIFRMLPR